MKIRIVDKAKASAMCCCDKTYDLATIPPPEEPDPEE